MRVVDAEGETPVQSVRITTKAISLAAALAIGALGAAASASPIRWGSGVGGNGHYYDLVSAPGLGWLDAFSVASTMQFLGVFGDLATLTSDAEHQFVADAFADQISGGAWIGGYQFAGLSDPSAGWNWVSGEAWSFTAWNDGSPDDLGGTLDETYARMLAGNGKWDDLDIKSSQDWYVIEYAIVPGPGSAALAFAGVTLAMGRSPRRRN